MEEWNSLLPDDMDLESKARDIFGPATLLRTHVGVLVLRLMSNIVCQPITYYTNRQWREYKDY